MQFNPANIRSVVVGGSCALVVTDALKEAQPDWPCTLHYEHMQGFRARERMPPFSRTCLNPGQWRAIGQHCVAPVAVVAKLICSLPEPVSVEKARLLCKHHNVAAELTHAPLDKLQRPAPRPSADLVALPDLGRIQEELGDAVPLHGQSLTFNGMRLDVLQDTRGEAWFRASQLSAALGLEWRTVWHSLRAHTKKRGALEIPFSDALTACERECACLHIGGVFPLALRATEATSRSFLLWFVATVLPILERATAQRAATTATLATQQHHEDIQALNAEACELEVRRLRQELANAQLLQRREALEILTLTRSVSETFGLQPPSADDLQNLIHHAWGEQPECAQLSPAEPQDLIREQTLQTRLRNKRQRLENALFARRAAQELGWDVSLGQLTEERAALEALVQPAHVPDEGRVTASEYLTMRGHTAAQVSSLQVTFGRIAKRHYENQRGRPPKRCMRDYGCSEAATCVYALATDRELLAGSYQVLLTTDAYRSLISPAQLAIQAVG